MNWMREKDQYCLTQEQKVVQQIEEQRLVVEAERQKVAVADNTHHLQYQLELVLNEGTRLPLLWMDLPNKTKQIQCFKAIKQSVEVYQIKTVEIDPEDFQCIS